MKDEDLAIAMRLKIAREAIGISKTEMSRSLGVSLQRYSNWEYGLRTPDPRIVYKMKALYGITSDYIWGGDTSGLPLFIANKVLGMKKNQTF